MSYSIATITIGTDDPDRLAGFYKDQVGLKLASSQVVGSNDEMLYSFHISRGLMLNIIDQDSYLGKNKEPRRFYLNFRVDNLEQEIKRLIESGVKMVAQTTFADPDGNLFNLSPAE